MAEVNDEGFFDPDDADINQNYTTYLHEPGTHIPSVMFKGKGSEAEPYFYINDHLGTPQELVDFDGNIVWAALYEAYGMVNAVLIPKITQNIRFQGQYFDAESGLHYNRHRYYDPTTGRYITQDPIGLAGGLNSTQYVKNPTGWIDPLGLTSVPCNDVSQCGVGETPDDEITVYRSTNNGQEYNIYNESGAVLSDAGKVAYLEATGEGMSIPDALKKAEIASKKAHEHHLSQWGNIDQYARAHAEFGTELPQIGPRSLVSSTTNPNLNFGEYKFELKVKRSAVHKQTLETSTESEILLINGHIPK